MDTLLSRHLLTYTWDALGPRELRTQEMALVNMGLEKSPHSVTSNLFFGDLGPFSGGSGNKLVQEIWQSLCPGIIHSKPPFSLSFTIPLFFIDLVTFHLMPFFN